MSSTPRTEGFTQPAEWAPHEAVWLAWPSAADLWEDNLRPAQAEFQKLCEGIRLGSNPEQLEILVPDDESEADARKALEPLGARFHRVPFGDIWLRDTAPIWLARGSELASVRYGFNGWGGKYLLEHDDQVSTRIQAIDGRRSFVSSVVMEGGALEVDGEGTVLTTRQCLLNPNRNPSLDEKALEQVLIDTLGVEKVIWLDDGLLNDHTDGHIDTIARYVAPGVVCCMAPAGSDDPNAKVLDDIARSLSKAVDARGRKLEVVRVPSPGLLLNDDDEVMPASHVNFYIANHSVVVPTYGTPSAEAAVEAIGRLFPGRTTVGASATAILSGGGAFHCITQQVPRVTKEGSR